MLIQQELKWMPRNGAGKDASEYHLQGIADPEGSTIFWRLPETFPRLFADRSSSPDSVS